MEFFPTSGLMRPFSFLLLLALVVNGCSGDRSESRKTTDTVSTPINRPAHASPAMTPPPFDGTSAFGYLTAQTSFGPRNPNSPGHDLCLNYLETTVKGFADRVTRQEFTRKGYRGEVLPLTNIIASFAPEASTRILLCAHWDTRPRAEHDPDKSKWNTPILGANDGASGVAVLLEIAKQLKAAPPAIGVDIVLFDGEDYGIEGDRDMYLLGSRHFAAHLPPNYVPRFGILLDMIGDAQLEIPKEKNSVRFAPDVIRLIWDAARELGIEQFIDEPGEEVMDDHWPLNDAGIKTVDLIDFNYPDQTNRYWHTTLDTPEHCSPESLKAVGLVLSNVIYSQKP
jgi:glutaminyl-peptide cyclotransferase